MMREDECLIYGKKKDTPQETAFWEVTDNYLKENNVEIKDGTDISSIKRDMMFVLLESAIDQDMNEKLRYSKYAKNDYK